MRKSVEKRWLSPMYNQRKLLYFGVAQARLPNQCPGCGLGCRGGAGDRRRPFRRRRNEGRPCERHARHRHAQYIAQGHGTGPLRTHSRRPVLLTCMRKGRYSADFQI